MQEGGVGIWKARRKQEVYRRGAVTDLGSTEQEGDGGAGEVKWRRQSQGWRSGN